MSNKNSNNNNNNNNNQQQQQQQQQQNPIYPSLNQFQPQASTSQYSMQQQPQPQAFALTVPVAQTKQFTKREWSNGLCDCCTDVSECLCAFFCTFCYQCMLFSKAKEPCCSVLYGGPVPLRTKIRAERGINGSICSDYCTILWCPLLALIQMGLEVKQTEPLI